MKRGNREGRRKKKRKWRKVFSYIELAGTQEPAEGESEKRMNKG